MQSILQKNGTSSGDFTLIARHQVTHDVIGPFLATRVALLIVGWLANFFPTSSDYPLKEVLERGWHFSPYRLLDIWGRWDTGWYMSIVNNGYMLQSDYMHQQSNLVFFPLYPMFVRLLLWPIPDSWQTDGVVLLVGVVLSNLFLLGALLLLYCFAQEVSQDRGVAQRTVLYLLLFPTAFFLSCFYTDAAFLFFSVAALYAAQRQQWAWAALAAALLGVTRPLGILIAPILVWIYLSKASWNIRNVRANVFWLFIIPLPFLLYFAWIGQQTGDWLTPLNAQQPYFRSFAWPWETLVSPNYQNSLITQLEQIFLAFFLIVAFVACWRLPTAAYGLWVFALILPFLFTGAIFASLRYIVVAFPVYVMLAKWGKVAILDSLFKAVFFAIQVVLMIAWCQFYFIA